jgi:hypothetical protein
MAVARLRHCEFDTRCLSQKTHLCVMKFLYSAHFFQLRLRRERCVRRPSAGKRAPASGESWSPGGEVIQIGSTPPMKRHAVGAGFVSNHNLLHYSKDSLHVRFIPGFLSGHLNCIDRSCAVATAALWFPI